LENKDRQLRFWKIFTGVTVIYATVAIALLLVDPSDLGPVTADLGLILGGIFVIWVVAAPVAYYLWVKPRSHILPGSSEGLYSTPERIAAVKDIQMRYRSSKLFFGFFFLVLFYFLWSFLSWGSEPGLYGLWYTIVVLGAGVILLAFKVWIVRVRVEDSRLRASEAGPRLKRWWSILIGFSAVLLLLARGVSAVLPVKSISAMMGAIAVPWFIFSMASFLLFVLKIPGPDQ
jgi:hypothetical protein